MQPAPRYTITRAFRFGNLTFFDYHIADRDVREPWLRKSVDFMDKQDKADDGKGTCYQFHVQDRESDAWREEVTNGATINQYPAFEGAFDPQLADNEYDGRLGEIILLIEKEGPPTIPFHGGFFLNNIIEIREVRSILHVSASMGIGLPWESQQEVSQWFTDTKNIMRGLLKFDLPLLDGRVLRIDHFDFSTSDPSLFWTNHPSKFYTGDIFIQGMPAQGNTREDKNGAVSKLHRKDEDKGPDVQFPPFVD